MHILIVGQDSLRFKLKEVIVPDSDQGQNYRNICFQGFQSEMQVHGMRTTQQLFEIIITNCTGYGKTNSRPKAVTSTYPIPEFKYILLINPKFTYGFKIGRKSYEMLSDILNFCTTFKEPVPGRMSIGHGFLCGKCF